LSAVDRNWLVKNVLNLLGVYSNLVIANNKFKVLDFYPFKLAFFWSKVKVMVGKNFKDAMDIES